MTADDFLDDAIEHNGYWKTARVRILKKPMRQPVVRSGLPLLTR